MHQNPSTTAKKKKHFLISKLEHSECNNFIIDNRLASEALQYSRKSFFIRQRVKMTSACTYKCLHIYEKGGSG